MTIISEGLLLNSKYIPMGREEGDSLQPFLTQPPQPCNCLPCGLTVIHLRLCDRKPMKSLGEELTFSFSCSGMLRHVPECFVFRVLSTSEKNNACSLGYTS